MSGDNQAFARIISNTEALVAQIVFKLVENREDRRDLAQDIFMKVYASLKGFKFESKLSTWIARIAYNTCISHARKKNLVLEPAAADNEEEPEDEQYGGVSGNADDPAMQLFHKQRGEILRNEIERLPSLYKTLITLFHQEHQSYEEISMITGLPTGTVKNYIFRARTTLRTNLLAKYKKEEL